MKNQNKFIPKDGIAGLKENFSSDALSGFLVFLLALPLSLGIAKASEFPAIMGLITAMIGGILVSLISGSRLTIKGPAAGLIVIVAGAVAELGHGNAEKGWHLALGAIIIAGIVQILFGMIKLGSLVDFFPLSAVHGMLAAIGIIIISKQAHLIMGVTPLDEHGKSLTEPLQLLAHLPDSFMHLNSNVFIVGLVSLMIVFGWPKIRNKYLKKVPAPVIVLLVAIPMARLLPPGKGQLVHFEKNLLDVLAVNESFEGFSQFGTFLKYVIMFALVGSLESLLTVKAIDMLDPFKRKSNANKDLMAVGFGNMVAGILGGLPMISEVARSSSNVSNGAKTRWANFFHGVFIMIFLLLDLEFNDMIPNAALAAMLIGVGYKLASPREFGRMASIGREQLIIFLSTILVTLATDLLIGIAAGIVVKLITQIVFGAPVKNMFRADVRIQNNQVHVNGAAVFSNWLGIRKKLNRFKTSQELVVDVSNCQLVDHTVVDNLLHLQHDFENDGGNLRIIGLDEMEKISKKGHELSARRKNLSAKAANLS